MTAYTADSSQISRVQQLRRSFWGRAERTACILFRRALTAKAQPMQDAFLQRSALVLAPHADDETLGCGGIIALKRRKGTDVWVVVATDGSASHGYEQTVQTSGQDLIDLREKETRAACATLGVQPDAVRFLGLKDSKLSEHVSELSASILDLVHQLNPSEIYVCAQQDGHPDHTALAQATRLAIQKAPNPDIDLYEYPVWSFDFRSWRPVGKTNTKGFLHGLRDMMKLRGQWQMRSVDVSSVLETKTKALSAHRSQLGAYPPEPHWSGLPESFLSHFLTRKEIFRQIPRNEKSA